MSTYGIFLLGGWAGFALGVFFVAIVNSFSRQSPIAESFDVSSLTTHATTANRSL